MQMKRQSYNELESYSNPLSCPPTTIETMPVKP